MLGAGPHNDSPISDFYDPSYLWHALIFTDGAVATRELSPLLTNTLSFSQSALGELLRQTCEQTLTFSQIALVNTPLYRHITQSLGFTQAAYGTAKRLSFSLGHDLNFSQYNNPHFFTPYLSHVLEFIQGVAHNQKYGDADDVLTFNSRIKASLPHILDVAQSLAFKESLRWSPRFEEITQVLNIVQTIAKTGVMNLDTCGCWHFNQTMSRALEYDLEDTLTFLQAMQNDQSDHRLIFIQTVTTNAVNGICCKGADYIDEKTMDGDGMHLEFTQSVGLQMVRNLSVNQSLNFQNTVVYYD